MKATDLMVGDFVFVKPSMLPIQVAAIHKKKVGYHAVTNKLNWVRIGLLEPILPTDKILEKNGFEAETRTDAKGSELSPKMWQATDGEYFCLSVREVTDGLWLAEYSDYESSLPTERVLISYLYELQQFMRHCKIDKEIEP